MAGSAIRDLALPPAAEAENISRPARIGIIAFISYNFVLFPPFCLRPEIILPGAVHPPHHFAAIGTTAADNGQIQPGYITWRFSARSATVERMLSSRGLYEPAQNQAFADSISRRCHDDRRMPRVNWLWLQRSNADEPR